MSDRLYDRACALLVTAALAGCSFTKIEKSSGEPARAAAPRAEEGLPVVSEATAGMEHRAGLLEFWIDREGGRVWLAVPPPGADGVSLRLLYVEGLASGLGSNPVGLDRGQLGETRLVELRRLGPKLLVVQPNLRFRASSEDAAEQRAASESFASSVLWAAPVAALDPDGRALVDWTGFVVRDAHGAARTLERSGQGSFRLDAERSSLDAERCLAFPDNVVFEALLTFAGEDPGGEVRATAPDPHALSLVQHHALVRLPDDDYVPRPWDPREGGFAVSFADYAAPLDRDVTTRWTVRHRLRRQRPGEPTSPVEPIVYHVDPGVPEPVRSALIEGASWWAEAFPVGGFRVELLPPDAHPLDVRYHVIQWVHRATRGWSYGGGVIDPRTGEVVKGHVVLGSLRVRQDILLFEGLAGTARTGSGAPDDPVELALARIRQLSAHEVGHTLGLEHNFAASTYGRASVMDYPAPFVRVGSGGGLDFSRAYGVGIGAWDVAAIRTIYLSEPRAPGELPPDEVNDGLLFLSDSDARPAGASHPLANLWDNHRGPVSGLESAMAVRRVALRDFGLDRIRPGEPVSRLTEVLVPVYFHHRYQIVAAAKQIGGLTYDHRLRPADPARRWDEDPALIVNPDVQRRALETLLTCLEPAELEIPERALKNLAPPAPGLEPSRESFAGGAGPELDVLAAAGTLSELVVDVLLQPDRCQRLVAFHSMHAEAPGLTEVLDTLIESTFQPRPDSHQHEIAHVTQSVVVAGMIRLASDVRASAGVRSRVESRLRALTETLEFDHGDPDGNAHQEHLIDEIERFLDRGFPDAPPAEPAPPAPPGDPIGAPPNLASCSRSG